MGVYYGFACDDLRECIGGHDKLAYVILGSPLRSILAYLLGPDNCDGDDDYDGRWVGHGIHPVSDGGFDFDLEPGWRSVDLATLEAMKEAFRPTDDDWRRGGFLEYELHERATLVVYDGDQHPMFASDLDDERGDAARRAQEQINASGEEARYRPPCPACETPSLVESAGERVLVVGDIHHPGSAVETRSHVWVCRRCWRVFEGEERS